MATFMFKPVTRHRGGNLWSTSQLSQFSPAIVGDNGVFIGSAVGADLPLFGWAGENLANRTHRLQITSSGVAGQLRVTGRDTGAILIASFAVVDTQALDLTINVPANETAWIVGSGTGGVSAGSLTSPNLTDTTAGEVPINQDTQNRPKVSAGDFVHNRRGTVFANRIR